MSQRTSMQKRSLTIQDVGGRNVDRQDKAADIDLQVSSVYRKLSVAIRDMFVALHTAGVDGRATIATACSGSRPIWARRYLRKSARSPQRHRVSNHEETGNSREAGNAMDTRSKSYGWLLAARCPADDLPGWELYRQYFLLSFFSLFLPEA